MSFHEKHCKVPEGHISVENFTEMGSEPHHFTVRDELQLFRACGVLSDLVPCHLYFFSLSLSLPVSGGIEHVCCGVFCTNPLCLLLFTLQSELQWSFTLQCF